MPIQGSTTSTFVFGARITPQSDTIVLLPFNGTPGDTTTQDLASPRKYVTFYGSAELDSNGKFDSTSLKLDGTQDRVEVTLSERTYTKFTLEAWVNFTNFTTYAPILSLGLDEDNCLEYGTDGQRIRTRIKQNGVEVFNIITPITAIQRFVWRHYVLICDGTNMRFMIDGSTYAYYPNQTFPFPADRLTVGNFLKGIDPIGSIQGYIDEVRFSKTVRYSDPYDVPLLSLIYTDPPNPTLRNIAGTFSSFTTSTILINGANLTPDLTTINFINSDTQQLLSTSSTVNFVNSTQITATTDTSITPIPVGTNIDIQLFSPITQRTVTLPRAATAINNPFWTTPAGIIATYTMPNRNVNISVLATMPGGTGETITYSLISGSLPINTSLNTATGAIFGQAPEITVSQLFTFTIRATANNDPFRINDRTFSILQTITSPNWTTPAGNLFTVNPITNTVNQQLVATVANNDPITYSIVGGSLPNGVTLSSSGLLNGAPDYVTTNTTYTFTVRANANSDPYRITDRTFSFTVNAVTVSFSTATNLGSQGDKVATALSVSATANVGVVSYSLVSGTLPSGCSLNVNTGALGTPGLVTQDTVSTFTIRATSSAGGAFIERTFTATVTLYLDGTTSARANTSAQAIKTLTSTNTDGVYWINLPTVGATQIYCVMNSNANGGGWMMAMKATRGTTFNYSSSHWNTVTVLGTDRTDRADADAKFDTMNYFAAKDIMAVWPDITTTGGGLGTGTGNPFSCWTWLENNFNGGARSTLINFFNTAGTYNTGDVNTAGNYGGYFLGLAKSSSSWGNGIFSSQADVNFYGFNFKNPPNYGLRAYVRWGFGWNENAEGNYSSPATLVGGSVPGSNDVSGGIGMDINYGSYSAGDFIACCQDSVGINRSARVEVYIR